MSVIGDIQNFTIGIEQAVGGEVSKIASNLDKGVTDFATNLTKALEQQFGVLKTTIESTKGDIETDLSTFATTVASLGKQADAAVEAAFHTVTADVGKLGDAIKKKADAAVSSVQTASTYMRHTMRSDLDAVITDAKTRFDSIEAAFRTSIATHSNDFVTFAQKGVDGLVSDAKADFTKLNTLRKSLETDLEGHIAAVKQDLEDAKTKLKNTLDTVVAFAKNELVKVEGRLKDLAKGFDDIAFRVGLVAVILGAGFFMFQFVRYHAQSEEDKRPDESKNARTR